MPLQLKEELVLLCEGKADQEFLKNLMATRGGFPPFDLLPPESHYGATNFDRMLLAIRGSGQPFQRIRGVLVVADSADSPATTFTKVRQQIAKAGYPAPAQPNAVAPAANGHPATMVMLLPLETQSGALESLFVAGMVTQAPWLNACINQFLIPNAASY